MRKDSRMGQIGVLSALVLIGLVAGEVLTSAESEPGLGQAMAADSAAPPVQADSPILLAQGETQPALRPVSYTREQADRGEDRYKSACVECHGDDLKGGMNGGAPLRGVNFEMKYANGAPASALYLFTSTLMPPNSPGRYSANAYADLMAYILKRNGFRAGAPLPSDVDALDYLIMEK